MYKYTPRAGKQWVFASCWEGRGDRHAIAIFIFPMPPFQKQLGLGRRERGVFAPSTSLASSLSSFRRNSCFIFSDIMRLYWNGQKRLVPGCENWTWIFREWPCKLYVVNRSSGLLLSAWTFRPNAGAEADRFRFRIRSSCTIMYREVQLDFTLKGKYPIWCLRYVILENRKASIKQHIKSFNLRR